MNNEFKAVGRVDEKKFNELVEVIRQARMDDPGIPLDRFLLQDLTAEQKMRIIDEFGQKKGQSLYEYYENDSF